MQYVLKNTKTNKYLGEGDFTKSNKSEATLLDKEKATKYSNAFNVLKGQDIITMEEVHSL